MPAFSPSRPGRFSRRAALRRVALGSTGLLLACGRKTTAIKTPEPQPADSAAALAALRTTPRLQILNKIGSLIEAGLSHDALRAALVSAWAGTDGDVHGGLALHALFAIERELTPRRRLLALFRACDHVVAHRDAWKPWPALAQLPATLFALPRKELVKTTRSAFDRLDGPAVRLGVRALHQRWGQEVVTAELLSMAAREDGNGGHGSHGIVAGLDLLRVVNWQSADAVLDQMVSRLQPPGSWQAPPSEAARAAFARHQRLVREAGDGWQGGVRRVEASRALREAVRTDRRDDLVQQVQTQLSEKIHADALWDGLALAAADMALVDATPSGPGVHALLLVAALRQSAARAPTPQARLIALLSAAWRLPGHRPAVTARINPMAVLPADGATVLVSSKRARRAQAIRSAAGTGGAPSLAVRDGMRDLLLLKDAPDPHRLELPVAATRLAAVCAPPLQGDVLAAVAACGPEAKGESWPRMGEAERLAKKLRSAS